MLQRYENGGIYGACPVLLQRDTEVLVGSTSPFGGVMMEDFEGRRFVEEPRSWWEGKGFAIIEPPILEEARSLARRRVAKEA